MHRLPDCQRSPVVLFAPHTAQQPFGEIASWRNWHKLHCLCFVAGSSGLCVYAGLLGRQLGSCPWLWQQCSTCSTWEPACCCAHGGISCGPHCKVGCAHSVTAGVLLVVYKFASCNGCAGRGVYCLCASLWCPLRCASLTVLRAGLQCVTGVQSSAIMLVSGGFCSILSGPTQLRFPVPVTYGMLCPSHHQ